MAYEKTNWTNTTPINITNLNKIEDGISEMPQTIQPIGSIYITSTNESPSSYLGGIWELIDKDFIETTGSMNDAFAPNSDITTGHKLAFERNKDTIRIRLQLTLGAGLNDNDTHLGNIDFQKLGTTGFYYNIFNMPVFFDTGNTIFCVYVGTAGEIITKDILVRGGATSTPVTEGYIDFSIPVRSDTKLDSACDKFYWKRIA